MRTISGLSAQIPPYVRIGERDDADATAVVVDEADDVLGPFFARAPAEIGIGEGGGGGGRPR